ncbi:MAG: hypothetical protein KY395_07140 [Actinobacteria bacterium]|nr:hypothetical protein [Actinomycetota bacterium]
MLVRQVQADKYGPDVTTRATELVATALMSRASWQWITSRSVGSFTWVSPESSGR